MITRTSCHVTQPHFRYFRPIDPDLRGASTSSPRMVHYGTRIIHRMLNDYSYKGIIVGKILVSITQSDTLLFQCNHSTVQTIDLKTDIFRKPTLLKRGTILLKWWEREYRDSCNSSCKRQSCMPIWSISNGQKLWFFRINKIMVWSSCRQPIHITLCLFESRISI